MKKGKRILALLLTCIMITGVICGCGREKPENYEVLVNDAAGNPVSGVTVQFCSDTECMMEQTGDDGVAEFDRDAGSYTIHVLQVPEGYASDNTEYTAPDQPDRVTIVLNQG